MQDRHPSERFRAPASIQTGVPLKGLLDRRAVTLIGESFAAVFPAFDQSRFIRQGCGGLVKLGLMERAGHIAQALAGQLPATVPVALRLVIAALGPPLEGTAGFGLRPFFYLPHSAFIARYGVDHPDQAMAANRELTRRFTAEFSLRPLLIAHQACCLRILTAWTADPDAHVRRLVSEGTRPRLPWAMRLPAFQRDPTPVLPLLDALKDDPVLYVRRSVANHLADIAKDHPRIAFAICQRWLEEVGHSRTDPVRAKARRWMVRHALRLPARKGVREAVHLRAMA